MTDKTKLADACRAMLHSPQADGTHDEAREFLLDALGVKYRIEALEAAIQHIRKSAPAFIKLGEAQGLKLSETRGEENG